MLCGAGQVERGSVWCTVVFFLSFNVIVELYSSSSIDVEYLMLAVNEFVGSFGNVFMLIFIYFDGSLGTVVCQICAPFIVKL